MNEPTIFTYRYPHPAVAVDIVVFTLVKGRLHVLLVQRGVEPYQGLWALPGGFVGIDEDLDVAAARELREEAGVSEAFLEQLGAFGAPNRDPRERVISVGFWSTVPHDKLELTAGSDASAAALHPISNLPSLAFDHGIIVDFAHDKLLEKLKTSTIALEFLPEEFTIAELQAVHESILGQEVDKRNFRKWARDQSHIHPTGKKRRGQHRPAEVFRAEKSAPGQRVVDLDSVLPAKPKPVTEIDKQAYGSGYDAGYRAGAESVQKLFAAAYQSTIERKDRDRQ